MLFAAHVPGTRAPVCAIRRGAAVETQDSCRGEEMVMMAYNRNRFARAAFAIAAIWATLATAAAAQTRIKFSLGLKLEGPSAPLLVGLDKTARDYGRAAQERPAHVRKRIRRAASRASHGGPE